MSASRKPWPSVIARTRSTSRSTNGAWTARAITSREPAEQIWPAFSKIAPSTLSTALSRSASASTTTGDLPPSSSTTRVTLVAAPCITSMPEGTEPVNVT